MKYCIRLKDGRWGKQFKWCVELFGPQEDRWIIYVNYYVEFAFKNEQDAVLFTLKWG